MQHIIRKQIIELSINSRQDGFGLQSKMSEYYKQEIIPVLEKIFDTVSVSNEIISIDRLELDLGIFSLTELHNEMKEGALLHKLEAMFYEEIKRAGLDEMPKRLVLKPAFASAFEQWLYYMGKGVLPWNLLRVDDDWRNAVLENFATDYNAVSLLRGLIQTNPILVKRIVLQHEPLFLQRLVEVLTSIKQESLTRVINEMYLIIRSLNTQHGLTYMSSEDQSAYEIWQCILSEASVLSALGETPVLAEAVLISMTTEQQRIALKNIQFLEGLEILKPVIKKIGKKLNENKLSENPDAIIGIEKDETNDKNQDEKIPARSVTDRYTDKIESAEKEVLHINQEDDLQTFVDKQNGTDEDAIVTGLQTIGKEGIYIYHAGMVMVHPFVHSLFKRTGLVKDGSFVNLMAQQKAIYLMHFLTTGEVSADEYQLAMAKILCAFPLEEAIARDITITNDEKQEAENLLSGVIEHWGVKNISTDGLRGNFLTRSGKLSSKNEQLCVVIENNAVDILLKTYPLPWNMSIIKFPWHRQAIYVEW